MRRVLFPALALALLLASSASSSPATHAQALRTCVDRWNQDNMLGWGPTLVSVAVRRLGRREQEHVGVYDHERQCTVSLAVSRVYTQLTNVCVINQAGGYWCSRYADGNTPLRNKNGATDSRGVLTLDVPLEGTHPTPPLAWQRRYPHVDGFIHPWTAWGRLRPGLRFGPHAYRGTCERGSEYAHDGSALRCYENGGFDPCFAPTRNWNRSGVVVACADAGFATFTRFTITRRS